MESLTKFVLFVFLVDCQCQWLSVTPSQNLLGNTSTYSIDDLLKEVNQSVLEDCMEMFNKMGMLQQKINHLADEIEDYDDFLPNEPVQAIMGMKKYFLEFRANMTMVFTETVSEISTDKTKLKNLVQLIENISNTISWIENQVLTEFQFVKELIVFKKEMSKLNISHITKSYSLKVLLMENRDVNIYVLHYNTDLPATDLATLETFRGMTKNRKLYGKSTIFATINLEISSNSTKQKSPARISLYKNEILINDNFQPNHPIDNGHLKFVWQNISDFNIEFDLFGDMITGTYEKYNPSSVLGQTFISRCFYTNDLMLMAKAFPHGNTVDYNFQFNGTNHLLNNFGKSLTVKGIKINTEYHLDHIEILTNPHQVSYKWTKSLKSTPAQAVECGKEFEDISYCGRMKIKDAIIPVKIINGKAFGEYKGYQTSTNFEYLVYDY